MFYWLAAINCKNMLNSGPKSPLLFIIKPVKCFLYKKKKCLCKDTVSFINFSAITSQMPVKIHLVTTLIDTPTNSCNHQSSIR